jgi:hypothetical protein
VLGAFKATPIRQLETESYVPPLNLWLNGRIARFQARMEHSGTAQKIREACSTYKKPNLAPYEPPAPSQRTASYYTRGRTEATGRGMDWTATEPMELAGKEISPPGLGEVVARRYVIRVILGS